MINFDNEHDKDAKKLALGKGLRRLTTRMLLTRFGCMAPSGTPYGLNLFRCLSTDSVAHGSVRIVPPRIPAASKAGAIAAHAARMR